MKTFLRLYRMFPLLKGNGGLWSAELIHTNPRLLKDIHKDYLRAGADIIITSTYQVCLIVNYINCTCNISSTYILSVT